MAFAPLAILRSQVKGVMFYSFMASGACRGERVVIRRPYDVNCLDVRLVRGHALLGHLDATTAARLSPLMRDFHVAVSG